MNEVLELFSRGGVVMWIIAGLSVYAIAVIILKTYHFSRVQNFNKELLDEIRGDFDIKKMQDHLAEAPLQRNIVADIMLTSFKIITTANITREAAKEEISIAGLAKLRKLESHMRGLELVANISPLLGLLGTVIGMVAAFSTIEQAGSKIDPSLLAGGIWTALLTTVAGLSVAIPALAAYYVFDSKIESIRSDMRDVSTRVLSQLDLVDKTNRSNGDAENNTSSDEDIEEINSPKKSKKSKSSNKDIALEAVSVK